MKPLTLEPEVFDVVTDHFCSQEGLPFLILLYKTALEPSAEHVMPLVHSFKDSLMFSLDSPCHSPANNIGYFVHCKSQQSKVAASYIEITNRMSAFEDKIKTILYLRKTPVTPWAFKFLALVS